MSDRQSIQTDEKKADRTGRGEIAISIPVSVEVLYRELAEVILPEIGRRRHCVRGEDPVRQSRYITPEPMALRTSMGHHLVEVMQAAVAEVNGIEVEAGARSWVNETATSCNLAVIRERTSVHDIAIVDETWNLIARNARTDGSLIQVAIVT